MEKVPLLNAFQRSMVHFLDKFIDIAAEKGYPACKNSISMTPDETWMREPSVQCEDEFLIYDEISELVFEYLGQINADFIVTEGAAYTPKIMKNYKNKEYITIIPTADFQILHYKEREWISYVLEGYSDKQQAFKNWMERDILFAKKVEVECKENGVPCIVNDGSRTQDEMFRIVKGLFLEAPDNLEAAGYGGKLE